MQQVTALQKRDTSRLQKIASVLRTLAGDIEMTIGATDAPTAPPRQRAKRKKKAEDTASEAAKKA